MEGRVPAPLSLLPVEIFDAILSYVDQRHDLISLASCASYYHSLIVPRHSEYREICISAKRPDVWAHLARRADLAKGIRVLYMIEDSRCLPYAEHYPSTWVGPRQICMVDEAGDHDAFDNETARHIANAIRNMELLHKFVWVQPWASNRWKTDSSNHGLVLQALHDAISLREFKIVDRSLNLSNTIVCEESALWRISQLRTLHLNGLFNCHVSSHSHLASMLKASPDLEDLSLAFSIESPSLLECKLPRLRKLVLAGCSRSRPRSDDLDIAFLEAHPTIEELTWYPSNFDCQLSPGSLPNIKSLTSHSDFVMSVLQDDSVPRRPLESISRIFLDSTTLPLLEKMDGHAVREVAIGQYDDLDSIRRLSQLFPNLVSLDITKFGPQSSGDPSFVLDDYINTISLFHSLKRLPDIALWGSIDRLGDRDKLAAVTNLVALCPNLHSLGHWDDVSKKVVDIVLVRNAGAKVTWKTCPRLP